VVAPYKAVNHFVCLGISTTSLLLGMFTVVSMAPWHDSQRGASPK
jgi:hypothetical protein